MELGSVCLAHWSTGALWLRQCVQAQSGTPIAAGELGRSRTRTHTPASATYAGSAIATMSSSQQGRGLLPEHRPASDQTNRALPWRRLGAALMHFRAQHVEHVSLLPRIDSTGTSGNGVCTSIRHCTPVPFEHHHAPPDASKLSMSGLAAETIVRHDRKNSTERCMANGSPCSLPLKSSTLP